MMMWQVNFPRKEEKYEDCNIPAAVLFVYLVLLDFQYQLNYCVHFVDVVQVFLKRQ